MNDFETKVLSEVKKLTGPVTKAQFTNGTLFVECSASTATALETRFLEAFQCGVIVSKVGQEYSFDFV